MKKHLLRNIIVFLLLGVAFSSCNQMFLQQKFNYLRKVAVLARTETDSVIVHISKYNEIQNSEQKDSLNDHQIGLSENLTSSEKLKSDLPGPIQFTLSETKRIIMHDLKPHSLGRQSDSKASAGGINGWVLGVLVFFGSLLLFALVISWAIQEQMGCLASGLAVFALLFEIWLVMFVLM